MADWVWVESAGTTLNEEPRVKRARFGDGYEQRAADGINNLDQVWEYTADEVDDVVADDMVAFLRARNGVEAFNYWPMRAGAAIRVQCAKWSRSHTGPGTSSVRATFQQVFEP